MDENRDERAVRAQTARPRVLIHYAQTLDGRIAQAVGPQTLDRWTAYSSFLYREGLLTGANGKPLTAPPDYSKLFTNDFLPGGP